jgi:hypothetical protein
MLNSMQYCAFERFVNESSIYQCNTSNLTCSPLPQASAFCAIMGPNGTSNGSSSSSSSDISSSDISSSGSSSDISSISSGISSIISSLSGGSSSWSGHPGSSGGVGTNNTDGNSAGMVGISWSLLVGLILIAPALS